MALQKLRKHQQALDSYNKALFIKPDSMRPWGNLGIAYHTMNCQYQAQYYSKMAADLKAVLTKQASTEQYIGIAREVYGAYKHWKQAWNCVASALKLCRKQTDREKLKLYGCAAEVLIELGKPKRAQVYIQRAEKQNHSAPELFYPLALLHQKNGDIEAAQQALEKHYHHYCTKLSFDGLLRLARLFKDLNHKDYALKVCREAKFKIPPDVDTTTKVVQTPPSNWKADCLHAQILWQLDDRAIQAAKEFAKLLAHPNSQRPQVYLEDSKLALAQGDLKRAQSNLKAIKNQPEISKAEQQPLRNICAKMLGIYRQ